MGGRRRARCLAGEGSSSRERERERKGWQDRARGTHGLSEGLRGGYGRGLHARLTPSGDAFPPEAGVV